MTIEEFIYQAEDLFDEVFNKKDNKAIRCINILAFLNTIEYKDISGLKNDEVKALIELHDFCNETIGKYADEVSHNFLDLIRKYKEDNNLENKTKEELIEIIKNYQK